MSPQLLAGLVVAGSLAAWGLFVAYNSMSPKGRLVLNPAPVIPPGTDFVEPRPTVRSVEDIQDVSRRKFLNRGMGAALIIGLGQFTLASLDFLYPRLRGGFGAKITVGDVEQIRNEISAAREPKFIPDGRFFITLYEGDSAKAAAIPTYKAANVDKTGIMALYRKCVHLGCSVPWCPPAKWFECPCHGSKYSINGEYRDGPAPRSLDQFRVEIVGGKIVVDTSTIIPGAPRGTITSQPQPEGVHCVNIKAG